MIAVEVKYGIDMGDVRRVEALMGRRLPDILEPLRQADGNFEEIKASVAEYQAIAAQVGQMSTELEGVRAETNWSGEAGMQASGALDVLLTILKWIGAILLFVIAALLMLLACLLYAIGAILQFIGTALAVVAAAVAVLVILIGLVRTGGKGNSGRAVAIWGMLESVFDSVFMKTLGITGAIGDGLGWVFEQAAKAIMWLALWLVEVGAKWTDSPDSDIRDLQRERHKIYD